MNHKDMLTNPAFCPIPWTGLMYNFDGAVKNCIRSATTLGNIKDNTIEDIVGNNSNVARQAMILGRQFPSNCKPCHDLEIDKKNFDIISDRIFYIRELKQVPLETYRPNNFDLQTVDVRWTNLCNFACVYCSPQFSSKWAAELKVIQQVPTEQQQETFKQYIFDRAKNLKHVYMAGGEPLLMKENLELLDRLDPNVNLRINTNLSKVDTQVFDRICQFKNVHWTISIESCSNEFEYIRHGGAWQDFVDNLMIIQKLDHKISFNMLHLVLNHLSIFDCIDYLKYIGFHNNSFVAGPLLTPKHLNILNLPETAINEVRTALKLRLSQKPGYLLENSYQNMLAYLDQPFDKNLSNTFKQLEIMDQRRGLDSKKIFKDLYRYE